MLYPHPVRGIHVFVLCILCTKQKRIHDIKKPSEFTHRTQSKAKFETKIEFKFKFAVTQI